jgi:hypothetical protein
MKWIFNTFISTTLLLLSGCSGHLYTVLNPELGDPTTTELKEIEGILAYPVINVVEVYDTNVLVDEKTKEIVARAPDCVPERRAKFATRADYSDPYQLKYEPGLFETNTFAATLNNGVLASVNTSSDPSKSATVAAALLPFVTAPKLATADVGKKFCNAQPKLIGVFEAPGVRPYEEIPN